MPDAVGLKVPTSLLCRLSPLQSSPPTLSTYLLSALHAKTHVSIAIPNNYKGLQAIEGSQVREYSLRTNKPKGCQTVSKWRY